MMSYLMQPDKQYAGTDSIKGNEWGTHMTGLYAYLRTSTHTEIFRLLASYINLDAHSAA